MLYDLPDFLPGRMVLQRGSRKDYLELEQFHYLPKRPATWADVWVIRYFEDQTERHATRNAAATASPRLIAVGVLSYPVPRFKIREKYFELNLKSWGEYCRFANANLRTISRIIVHPQFRSLGLSTILAKCLCDHCPTRYVEAMALMARAHPFFDKAGMTRVEPDDPAKPVYFVFDRNSQVQTNAAA